MRKIISFITFIVMLINSIAMITTYWYSFHYLGEYTPNTLGDILIASMFIIGLVISFYAFRQWRHQRNGVQTHRTRATYVRMKFQGHNHHTRGYYDIFFLGHIDVTLIFYLVNLMNVNAVNSRTWEVVDYDYVKLKKGTETALRIVGAAAFEESIKEYSLDFALGVRNEQQLMQLN